MEQRGATFSDYVRIARPDHWIKNLFILPGTVAAAAMLHSRFCASAWGRLAMALVSTCLVASANYVINEWLDAKFDRFHPTKKTRPVVVASVRRGFVWMEWAALGASGLALSLCVGRLFALMALWLFVMGLVYNVEPVRTKDLPFLDVLSESVNNMIRLLMGWFVVTDRFLPPCSLILGYWMVGAFLMAAKRFAEFRMIGDPERAGLYRRSFRRYSECSLLVSSVVYALASSFLLGAFLVKYRLELLVAIPFMFALFGKYLAIAYKPDSAAQKPEKLYREKGLMLLTALFAASILVGGLVRMPWLGVFASRDLILLSK